MVNIGVVGMSMRDGRVAMRMRMRFCPVPFKVVFVPVMFIMAMSVRVLEYFVRMGMFVTFAQVQPDAERHQGRCGPEKD